MPTLTQREQRTIRIAGTGLAIYLVLFFGYLAWKRLEGRRATYQALVLEAQALKRDLVPYENRVLLTQKLKDSFHLEPRKLSRSTVVAEASAAIQNAAKSGGIQVGSIRESPARTSAKELASMQFEGVGPVPAIMTLLHRLEILGYPLVVDSVQINADPAKPGMVKLNLTIVILDFEQWKEPEVPRA
jgi:hypothetical protein